MDHAKIVWCIDPAEQPGDRPDERSLKTLSFLAKKIDAIVIPVSVGDPQDARVLDAVQKEIAATELDFAVPPKILQCQSSSVRDKAARVTHFAEDIDADFLTLSSRGGGGPQRWFLGSFAERVIAQSTVPVFILQKVGSHCAESWDRVREVYLFATDFSEFSCRAYRCFVAQVAKTHGEILLYHMEPPLGMGFTDIGDISGAVSDEYLAKQKEWIERQAESWAEHARLKGVRARVLLEEGCFQIGTSITRAALREHALMVALGYRSDVVASMYFGSVARDALVHQELPLWIAGPHLGERFEQELRV